MSHDNERVCCICQSPYHRCTRHEDAPREARKRAGKGKARDPKHPGMVGFYDHPDLGRRVRVLRDVVLPSCTVAAGTTGYVDEVAPGAEHIYRIVRGLKPNVVSGVHLAREDFEFVHDWHLQYVIGKLGSTAERSGEVFLLTCRDCSVTAVRFDGDEDDEVYVFKGTPCRREGES